MGEQGAEEQRTEDRPHQECGRQSERLGELDGFVQAASRRSAEQDASGERRDESVPTDRD